MSIKENGAAANGNPATVSFAGTSERTSTSSHQDAQVGRGPAPLHLLVDQCRCCRPRGKCERIPRAIVVIRGSSRFVGLIGSIPWGFGDRTKEFIGGSGHAAEKYARRLNEDLRSLAWRKHDHRALQLDLAMRQRIKEAGDA